MRCLIWAVFSLTMLCGIVSFPRTAQAGLELRLYNEDDNMIGEIWHEEDVCVRIGIIPSGAFQATSSESFFDLIVIPRLSGGFFTFHLQ